MTTTTERPLAACVTLTFVPNGKEECAAVNASWLNLTPLAVRFPLWALP